MAIHQNSTSNDSSLSLQIKSYQIYCTIKYERNLYPVNYKSQNYNQSSSKSQQQRILLPDGMKVEAVPNHPKPSAGGNHAGCALNHKEIIITASKEMNRNDNFLDVSEFILTTSYRNTDWGSIDHQMGPHYAKDNVNLNWQEVSAQTSTKADLDQIEEEMTPDLYYLGAQGLSPEYLLQGGDGLTQEASVLSTSIQINSAWEELARQDSKLEVGVRPEQQPLQSIATVLDGKGVSASFNSDRPTHALGRPPLNPCQRRNAKGRFKKRDLFKDQYRRKGRPIKNQDSDDMQIVPKQNHKPLPRVKQQPRLQLPPNRPASKSVTELQPEQPIVKRKVGRPRKIDKARP